jgi:octaprenyl-diphosphate synthase
MSEDLKNSILQRVKNDLAEIESELAENLQPHFDLVSQISSHILFSGGKRLRPLLMVISARLCGYEGTNAWKFSTIFEFLHAATLLHDDVVDGAKFRRGQPVAHAVWDSATAVLVGDFLLARSLTLAAETNSPRIIRVIAEITEYMSQGEIQQLAQKGMIELTEKEYMHIIQCKTAVLFAGACRSSAILSDASNGKETALNNYGLNLGFAFQMVDDLLDYTADSNTLGKRVGADLREGKLTLPVIYALQSAKAKERDKMVGIIQNKDFTEEEFDDLVNLLIKHGSIEYTQNKAKAFIRSAKQSLDGFNSGPGKELLYDIADYALVRKI